MKPKRANSGYFVTATSVGGLPSDFTALTSADLLEREEANIVG